MGAISKGLLGKTHCVLVISALLIIVAIFGVLLYGRLHKPPVPYFGVEAIQLQNISLSAYFTTAEWNVTFSVQNPNNFGFSYDLKATVYDSTTGEFLWRAASPPLSQRGRSSITFPMALFGGKPTSVAHRCAGGDVGEGNLGSCEVSLDLHLAGKIRAMPKGSISWLIHIFADSVRVECEKATVGIRANTARPTQYDRWTAPYCRSYFDMV